ncbi:MAG: hypothetical protein RMJ87_02830 [Cytophagales bacterium]|nr:hypothetical protein [Bernardetiaceae bacterium]MDW8203941.1 hypothetical protein [Cytophagales bacterium]
MLIHNTRLFVQTQATAACNGGVQRRRATAARNGGVQRHSSNELCAHAYLLDLP